MSLCSKPAGTLRERQMADDNDGGAAGGSGKVAGTESGTVLSGLATTLSQVVQIVKALETIDGFTHRSVVCEVDNVSGRTLLFQSSHFDHGGLGTALPPTSIADQKTGLFGAGSSGLLVGVEGRVTYGIDDGRGSSFTVDFVNPEIGPNGSGASINSPISNTYFAFTITGNGNSGAHMRYVLGHLNPPFSLKAFLRNTTPAGFDPSAPSTSLRSLRPVAEVLATTGRLSLRSFMRV
jgi:hypothetical protein